MVKEIKLVVLNPVIKALLKKHYQTLVELLYSLGWYVEDASRRDIPAVKELYKDCLRNNSKRPVIDSRCPAAVQLISDEFPNLINYLSPIKPILITGAELALAEFKEIFKKQPISLTIVSPCNALTRYGDERYLIITWKKFKEKQKLNFPEKPPENSPVPLGFFNELGVAVVGASGENNIRKLLANFHSLGPNFQIIELLFCEGGCHNGDGL